jgi:hypothetical protein
MTAISAITRGRRAVHIPARRFILHVRRGYARDPVPGDPPVGPIFMLVPVSFQDLAWEMGLTGHRDARASLILVESEA